MTGADLNVYSGPYHRFVARRHIQVRVIVASPSGAAARRALAAAGLRSPSRTEWAGFWGETGNALDRAVALANPGEVLWQPDWGQIYPRRLRGVWVPWDFEHPSAATATPPVGYGPPPARAAGP